MTVRKPPRAFGHLRKSAMMRGLLERQSPSDAVIAAAMAAGDRASFCTQVGLSWPAARRRLWEHRSEVLEHAGRALERAERDLYADAAQLDKGRLLVRQAEIGRLRDLWVVRYLSRRELLAG